MFQFYRNNVQKRFSILVYGIRIKNQLHFRHGWQIFGIHFYMPKIGRKNFGIEKSQKKTLDILQCIGL